MRERAAVIVLAFGLASVFAAWMLSGTSSERDLTRLLEVLEDRDRALLAELRSLRGAVEAGDSSPVDVELRSARSVPATQDFDASELAFELRALREVLENRASAGGPLQTSDPLESGVDRMALPADTASARARLVFPPSVEDKSGWLREQYLLWPASRLVEEFGVPDAIYRLDSGSFLWTYQGGPSRGHDSVSFELDATLGVMGFRH